MIPGLLAICAGERCCRIPLIGSPGITRGSRNDTVNATQRIEDLCKEFKWDLLIGETTYELAKDIVEVGEPHRITLRGRQQETLVYPVLGLKSGAALQEEAEAIATHLGETVAPSLAGGDGIGS